MANTSRRTLVLAVAGLALLAALLLLRRDDGTQRGGEGSPAESAVSGAETPDAGVERPTSSARAGGAASGAALSPLPTLLSGETLEIAAASLPSEGPLVLTLQLGEPSTSAEPLGGRILTEGRPPLEFSGAVLGDDRSRLQLEVDPGWLSPGRYVIEVRTTERSHLPLRRYALQVE